MKHQIITEILPVNNTLPQKSMAILSSEFRFFQIRPNLVVNNFNLFYDIF